ncbi:coiled-coil domain-containing protein 86 [Schistocerca cancellata]|uniref:coiled-coil domain-containing protein 86 n=1 Tax=Schistocerca cancellata TaxID=274614 RepID=UPI0021178F88|nr:coiled-coil domain-containing protein 86 [Schistocerca cancellata]
MGIESVEKVLKVEDVLSSSAVGGKRNNGASEESSSENEVDVPKVVRGRPKSGRVWKTQKKRASSIVKTRGLQLSLEKRRALQESIKQTRELSKARKEQFLEEKKAKKLRRKLNLERQEANRRKSEVVQVIKNTAKIKKMKKKLLRKIEKRDTTDLMKH